MTWTSSSTFAVGVAQDFRVALRRMRRAPALAAAIVLTIGIGLGAAAAIFTASDAALVEPLPYTEPRRLVHLWEVRAGTEERSPTSYPTLQDWRSRANSFSALEGYDPTNFTVGFGDEARMLRGARVTPGFFELLGVRMSLGRDFQRAEDAVDAGVAIVTERFARSLTSGPALGRSITINGTPFTVAGVLPATFHFALLQNADVFVTRVPNDDASTDRLQRAVHVIGRLRDGVQLAAGRDQLAAVMAELANDHPDALAGRTISAEPLREALLGSMKHVLTGLLVAVALLVLIMGANLALLTFTRYVERAPELAMRSALGANRARILRQLLVECLVPSIAGAALAVGVGQITTLALLDAIPDGVRIGMPYLSNAALDAKVIMAIVGLTTSLAIAFGVGPALAVTGVSGRAGDARTTLARGDRRLRRGLVAAQMALTVVLLVSSGLLVVSFAKVVGRDVGFRDPDGLVTARAPLSGPRYEAPGAQQQFYEALLAQGAALPGVRHAALINEVPGGGGGVTTFEAVDRPTALSAQPRAVLRIVGGEYFTAMGIPVVAGRAFDSRDRADSPPAAVVSASFARLLARDGATVGRRLRLAETGATEWDVVGVVGDVQAAALDADSPPVIYLSHRQAEENRMTLVLRTELGVSSVASQLKAIVKGLDPGIPVYAVTRLDQQLGESRAVFSRRFPMIVSGVFAVAALVLTLVALYGTCAHEVVSRRREFGIRTALGATPAAIRRLVIRDVLPLGAGAIGAGVIVAALVSRLLHSVLFGISASDWRVYAVVAAGVLVAALVATLGPALRAGSVNPNVVMRHE